MWADPNLVKVLKGGGVVVMPTDTLYGIVGRAEDASVVDRIYTLRKRNPEKPCIILIGDDSELEKFYINLSLEQKNKLKEFWPGPVSIILDCPMESCAYLHRGTKTLAFRVPDTQELRDLLLKTGPLIAPSANPEGMPTALNVEEAKKYFSNSVDLYVDGSDISGKTSRLIRLHPDGSVDILRE